MKKIFILLLVLTTSVVTEVYAQNTIQDLFACGKCKFKTLRKKKRKFKSYKDLFKHLEFVPITTTKIHPDIIELYDLQKILTLPVQDTILYEAGFMDDTKEYWDNKGGLTTGQCIQMRMINDDEAMRVEEYYAFAIYPQQMVLITFRTRTEEFFIQILEL